MANRWITPPGNSFSSAVDQQRSSGLGRLIRAFVGLLLLSAVALQGCLAIMWLGAVGSDRARTSDIEFQSFENSWVAASEEPLFLGSVQRIAVMPFVGDAVMAERWTVVLRQMTNLPVVRPSGVTWPGNPNTQREYPNGPTDQRWAELARRISRESDVDCVLFGSVTGHEPQKSFAGLKERSSQRLYLHLVSADGTLMWKTELPFTIVKGAKDLDEELVTDILLAHVRTHADELGLTELGAANQRTASRSLGDGSDDQRAPPSPVIERP